MATTMVKSKKQKTTVKAKASALTADLYNLKNEVVGNIELPADIFSIKKNAALVQQALLAQMANARRPWAHAKDRSEVRGGGRKPWRQKGTGRARHGSTRSPLWVGGGKAHGPISLRDYSQKINKKMKRLAMLSVLSQKLRNNEIKFVDSLNIEQPKTKSLFSVARTMLALDARSKKLDLLMIPVAENKNIFRASRNLVKAKAIAPESLNIYDLMNYKNLFIDQSAIPALARYYSSNK
jgi:large subunit ribosomal protein L4